MHRSNSDSSKTLSNFIHEETTTINHHHHHHQVPHRRSLDTMLSARKPIHSTTTTAAVLSPKSSPLLTPSPRSSWSFSPPCTPSFSSPFLHHCISSLHRGGNIHSIAISKGLVLTGSSTATIRAWRPLTSSESGYIQASSGEVRAMLAHGDLVFTSHKDRRIRVWNNIGSNTHNIVSKVTTLPKPNPLKFLTSKTRATPHKDIISCMAYNHVEEILYTGSWDKTVKAWRLSDRKCTDSFMAHNDNINDMVVNRDGNLFTCSSDGLVKMWSQVRGETFHTLTMTLSFLPFPTYALALREAPESRESVLYSGSSDGCLNLWERKISGGYSHVGSIHAHHFAVLCLTVLDDMVISGSADSSVKIWKKGIGNVHHCVAVLDGHKGPVKCVSACVEGDGSNNNVKGFLVFSASLDHTFKVWRVKRSEEDNNVCVSNNSNNISSNYYGKNEYEESPVLLSPTWVRKVQLGRLSGSY